MSIRKPLSKSRIMSFRQCTKRLWLEVHNPSLRVDSNASQSRFETGHAVGKLAQQLFDPDSNGELIDIESLDYPEAFERTRELVATEVENAVPIFEAAFCIPGALAFADILLPDTTGTTTSWRMIEVKSSTSIKDHHYKDVAVQTYVARSAGVPISRVSIAHINNAFVYPGHGDYAGLFVEEDVTSDATNCSQEVKQWIEDAHAIASTPNSPEVEVGKPCSKPAPCPFLKHCCETVAPSDFPVTWLPSVQTSALKACLEQAKDMRDVPDELLNELQLRVKTSSLSNETFFDADKAKAALSAYDYPLYFLDFETVNFGIPIWQGTRPYQQIPFQYSLHRISESGELEHIEFLDISESDPSERFAKSLVSHCGENGPVFVYNSAFESARINELAIRFPRLSAELVSIKDRIVDLHPIAKAFYYHPGQEGSWSIKRLLPAIAPDLDYGKLEGVKNGEMAMDAFMEAMALPLDAPRRAEIESQLRSYCALDTFALVRIWSLFSDR